MSCPPDQVPQQRHRKPDKKEGGLQETGETDPGHLEDDPEDQERAKYHPGRARDRFAPERQHGAGQVARAIDQEKEEAGIKKSLKGESFSRSGVTPIPFPEGSER